MKLTLLEQITAGLNQQIAEAHALLAYLRKYGTDHPAEAAATTAPLKPTRKPIAERQRIKIGKAAAPVKRAAQPAPTTPATVDDFIGKPLTIGGAMKKLIAGLNKFTGQELRDKLLADPPVAKLIQEGNPGSDTANLRYWAKVGYLNMAGETQLESTFTVANRDFFTR